MINESDVIYRSSKKFAVIEVIDKFVLPQHQTFSIRSIMGILFRYCDAPGLPTPRGQCDAGYLCLGGAYTSTPTDEITGKVT